MRSPLWPSLARFTLSLNMRIASAARNGASRDEQAEMQAFSDFLMSIGSGGYPTAAPGAQAVVLPKVINIEHAAGGEPAAINSLLEHVYADLPEMIRRWKAREISEADYAEYVMKRAILTPTLKGAETINNLVSTQYLPNQAPTTSLAADAAVGEQGDRPDETIPPELLHTLTLSGMPPHSLELREGGVYLLLRTLDLSQGLCNGTRLVLTRSTRYTLTFIVATQGPFLGHEALIPRIAMTSTDSGLSFQLQRIQFPVVPAWGMTINKSQGQTLQICGLYLDTQIFSHGQLYVALSRASAMRNLAVLALNSYAPALHAHTVRNIINWQILRECKVQEVRCQPPPEWSNSRWAQAEAVQPVPRRKRALQQQPQGAQENNQEDEDER
jgi:ATP-dependent DNA helicase PIF1